MVNGIFMDKKLLDGAEGELYTVVLTVIIRMF